MFTSVKLYSHLNLIIFPVNIQNKYIRIKLYLNLASILKYEMTSKNITNIGIKFV